METSAEEREIIELDKLPRKVLNNKVIVEVGSVYYDDGDTWESREGQVIDINGHKYTCKGGLKLILAGGTNEESSRVVRHGVVARIPDRLLFRSKSYPMGIEWKTELEIKEGDEVFVGVMASANGNMIKVGERIYLAFNYCDLIVRKRGDELYPLNGYFLAQKHIENKIKVSGLILDIQKDKQNKSRAKVTHVGRKNDKYYIGNNIDADIEVGDDVVLNIEAFTDLEDEMFSSLGENIGYCQRCWVIGKK